MKIDYSKLSAQLKDMYKAKSRICARLKHAHSCELSVPINKPLYQKVSTAGEDKLVNSQFQQLINSLNIELRDLALARAFIKGVPYSSVETNAQTPALVRLNQVVNLIVDTCCLPNAYFVDFKHEELNDFTMKLDTAFADWLRGATINGLFAQKEAA